VSRATVTVEGEAVGAIGRGLLLYLGVAPDDGAADVEWLAGKAAGLRIFGDDEGRMNLSVVDAGGAVLAVSQFTLYADTRRGRRPSFVDAAPPEVAEPLIDAFMARLRERGLTVEGGRFGAHMLVESENDGPVTILLDSADRERPRRG
jgi:D-tyrosyl-tRNA(Tyr) deacylase